MEMEGVECHLCHLFIYLSVCLSVCVMSELKQSQNLMPSDTLCSEHSCLEDS